MRLTPLALRTLTTRCALIALAGFGAATARAQEGVRAEAALPPSATLDLAALPPDVRQFHQHVMVLASPWMEGRIPGSRGMELAMEYMEFHFRAAGLVAPYERVVEEADGTVVRTPNASFRQPFDLGAKVVVSEGHLAVNGQDLGFAHGEDQDFVVTTMGAGGEVSGPLVFVGYGIDRGPREDREFSSFPAGLDLSGKVALVLRFEPMDAAGRSRWAERGWSTRAGFFQKLQALEKLGAAGAIIVNPPGADDPRADTLVSPSMGARSYVKFPVLHLSRAAGERLVQALDPEGRDLAALRGLADVGGTAVEMRHGVTLRAGLVKERLVAENVVALLPGKGALAAEHIVIGAHLDHLGQGEFGSRDAENAGRALHPGADDNASGCAGILMIAARMAQEYRRAPADAPLRSVIFIGFSAEESGLNGSAHYVTEPLVPIEQHVFMMNFDMIGRITNKRLNLYGTTTGEGLPELVAPFVEASPLVIAQSARMSGASDHTPFHRKGMPVLFAINDLHDDYHTPRDTVDRVNFVDAVHAIDLFRGIAWALASRPERVPLASAR